MRLGEIIKKYRTDHNLSMDDFSERSGISKSYISLLEKNRHPQTGKPITPSIQYIKQAADGMGMDFKELFSMIEGDVSLIERRGVITEDIHKKIFSKNLLFYLQQNQKTQREVALAVGVSPQTFNTWCQAIALPRMGKLQRIADYFKIEKSDLIDAHSPDTIQPVSLSLAENAVVAGYRAADQPTKTVVKRLLNVE